VALLALVLGSAYWVWRSGDTSGWQDNGEYADLAVAATPFATAGPVATMVVMDEMYATEPAPSPTSTAPTLTPIVVTPMPTDRDVFAAATRVMEATRLAAEIGTATPTPPNLVTATFTPTPFVIINTPTPGNQATAVYEQMLAQAEALTTGTPTPFPTNAVTATPRVTGTARPLDEDYWGGEGEAAVTPTSTPVFVLLSDEEALANYVWPTATPVPTPTALPAVLYGKIGFRSEMLGWQRTFVVDPDGGNLAILVNSWSYDEMLVRERLSPDRRYYVFQDTGLNGTDLFLGYADGRPPAKLTSVGKGLAYDPAWSPSQERIVFASNQEGDDDIFVVEIRGLDGPNPRVSKLTNGDTWESDKHPSYSPSGDQIVFYSNRTGRSQIWVMNADGTDAHIVFEVAADCWDPVWFK
jgi:Tol biopolymer transport system component